MPNGLHRASEWTWRVLLIAAAVIAAGWALSKVFLVVVVVIAALLMTALINPLADRLRRAGWSTGWATGVAMITGLALLVGIIGFVAPSMVDEFGALGDKASEGVREAQRWLVEGPAGLSPHQVDNIANGLVRQLQGGGGSSMVSGVVSGAVAVGSILAAALLAIVLTVFFVRDGRAIYEWLVGLLPRDSRARALQIGDIAWTTLAGYIRGIATIGLFDAVCIGIALAALGIPLVFPLMLLTFIAAFVPIVGATVAGLVSVLIALVDHGVTSALILLAVIIAVQQMEGNILYPVVMRRAVAVHPVAILLGVAVGGIIAGILGAIIAVPVVAIIGRVLELFREEQEQVVPPDESGPVILERDGEKRFVGVQDALTPASSRSTSD
ncbi:MAG: AI-2E family transporter [Solirubrobacteraceae bacterium]